MRIAKATKATKTTKATRYTLSNRSREKRGEGEEYRQSVIAEFTDYEEARRSAKARLNQPKARRVLFMQAWEGSEYLKEYTIKRERRDRMKYESGTIEGETIDLVYAMIEEERRQRKEAAKKQAAATGRPYWEILKEENAKHRPDELRRMAEARKEAKALRKLRLEKEAEYASRDARPAAEIRREAKEAKRQANREKFRAEREAKEAERKKAKEAKRQENRERHRAEREAAKKAAERKKEAEE